MDSKLVYSLITFGSNLNQIRGKLSVMLKPLWPDHYITAMNRKTKGHLILNMTHLIVELQSDVWR